MLGSFIYLLFNSSEAGLPILSGPQPDPDFAIWESEDADGNIQISTCEVE